MCECVCECVSVSVCVSVCVSVSVHDCAYSREPPEADGGEKVDGKACVPGIVSRQEALKCFTQYPETRTVDNHTLQVYIC